jgi:SNF2 family DNA or RNA helicase
MTNSFMFTPGKEPFEHQRRLFDLRKEERKWAHFWEMGTGKSWEICHEMAWAFLHGEIDCALIVAKKGEYANWGLYLIPELMPPNVEVEVVVFDAFKWALGKQVEALTSLFTFKPHVLRILVVNVESFAYRLPEVLDGFYDSSRRGVFAAVDESTCIKNYEAKRSKEAYVWGSKSKMKRIMTGTPVTQSPMDLWGQAIFMGKGLLVNTSFFSFRNTYCEFEQVYLGPNRSFKKVASYKNLDKLEGILSSFSDQVYKADCLDLPPKVYKKHAITMTDEQQRLYNQMRDEAIVELGDGAVIEVANALAQVTKLHQIACGQLKTNEGEYVSIPNNRVEALVEILEDFPGKAIIWANYRQTLEDVVARLREVFGADAVVDYYGGTPAERREYAVRAFQDISSPVRFFVANAQSAGYGLTLTAATLVVYYSNGYNLEHRLQSEDRAHRIGQTESVTYIDFVSPGTVDERILEVLRNKKNLAREVLGSPISEWI